jgi:hypothetical protein
MDKNIHKKLRDTIFPDYQETVWVYLKSSNTKGNSYDPYRQTGITTTNQSPEPVKAYIRQIRGNSLIARELGLAESGAIEIVIKSSDENLFRICQKVKYDDKEYTPFNKALGNRIQIFKSPFDFSRIVLFQRGN